MTADEHALSEQGLLSIDFSSASDHSHGSHEEDVSADSGREPWKVRRSAFSAVVLLLVGIVGILYHHRFSGVQSSQLRENSVAHYDFVERFVAVGPQPWCPGTLQMKVGCTENGHLDNDCCAFSGDGGCRDGSPVTEGKVCHENGAVATCCPPKTGPQAAASAAANHQAAHPQAAAPAAAPPAQIGGLYCWMLSANWGGEAALTRDLFAKKRGAFSCDEWSVLSNDPMPPVPVTKIGPLASRKASWGSYLNTEVFLRAWGSVIGQNKWSRHAWTIKADPDTVWFPWRLHWYVDKLNAHSPIFLRNSGAAYLGPLEVFSFGAVEQFAARHSKVCIWGIDSSGEDGWIEHCMQQLGVSEQTVPNLLKSDRSSGACGDAGKVAFHPFKDPGSMGACFGVASR